MSTTTEDLIKKYDLDVLEIEDGSVYIHYGRGLSMDEFNKLGDSIKLLMESTND